MSKVDDFSGVFKQLRAILVPYEKRLLLQSDEPGNYCLNASYSEKHRREIMFAGVQIMKNYVSYHLMPIYACPDLLETLSPELRKRMQGKACFNFKTIESGQTKELRELTKRSYDRFKKAGYIS